MDIKRMIRPEVDALPRPVHGGKAWKLKGIEDFSHNLNPFGPPECLGAMMEEAAAGVDHYPDDGCSELKEALSRRFGVGKENVIVGAGSSDLIRLFPTVFIRPGDSVLMPRPTFAEYSFQCQLMGGRINDLLLMEGEDFRLDVERTLATVNHSTKVLYLCNPNNPTGRVEERAAILEIVQECEKRGVLVFLDETLLELAPRSRERSCVDQVEGHDNLFVIGSMTKSFAIPGIRIGFGFGSKRLIDCMNAARLSWNVGHIEQCVATRLIDDHYGHVERAARMLDEERQWMQRELSKLAFPSSRTPDAYFFFSSMRPLAVTGHEMQGVMLNRGIMVRDCASFGRPFDNFIRFCVKDRERNEAFVHAMHDSLLAIGW